MQGSFDITNVLSISTHDCVEILELRIQGELLKQYLRETCAIFQRNNVYRL